MIYNPNFKAASNLKNYILMRQKNYISIIRVGILLFFLFPFHCFSQDISGVWTGNLYNDTTKNTIHFELAINDVKEKRADFHTLLLLSNDVKNIGVKELKIKIKR